MFLQALSLVKTSTAPCHHHGKSHTVDAPDQARIPATANHRARLIAPIATSPNGGSLPPPSGIQTMGGSQPLGDKASAKAKRLPKKESKPWCRPMADPRLACKYYEIIAYRIPLRFNSKKHFLVASISDPASCALSKFSPKSL